MLRLKRAILLERALIKNKHTIRELRIRLIKFLKQIKLGYLLILKKSNHPNHLSRDKSSQEIKMQEEGLKRKLGSLTKNFTQLKFKQSMIKHLAPTKLVLARISQMD